MLVDIQDRFEKKLIKNAYGADQIKGQQAAATANPPQPVPMAEFSPV